jgi:hypothetical protein
LGKSSQDIYQPDRAGQCSNLVGTNKPGAACSELPDPLPIYSGRLASLAAAAELARHLFVFVGRVLES